MVKVKYYIDNSGKFLGGFSHEAPDGAIEVKDLPDHGWQVYDINNSVWLPLTDEQKEQIGEFDDR